MHEFYVAYLDCLTKLHARVVESIKDLPAEALSWSPGVGMNSMLVLAVHLAGAERYWIGDVAGQDPSGRIRLEEFTVSGWSVDDLQALLDRTLDHSRMVIADLELSDLETGRLGTRDGQIYSVAWALNHALEHTGLHLGHLQIGRQLWEQRGE